MDTAETSGKFFQKGLGVLLGKTGFPEELQHALGIDEVL
jgi:hypothetical protein